MSNTNHLSTRYAVSSSPPLQIIVVVEINNFASILKKINKTCVFVSIVDMNKGRWGMKVWSRGSLLKNV